MAVFFVVYFSIKITLLKQRVHSDCVKGTKHLVSTGRSTRNDPKCCSYHVKPAGAAKLGGKAIFSKLNMAAKDLKLIL